VIHLVSANILNINKLDAEWTYLTESKKSGKKHDYPFGKSKKRSFRDISDRKFFFENQRRLHHIRGLIILHLCAKKSEKSNEPILRKAVAVCTKVSN